MGTGSGAFVHGVVSDPPATSFDAFDESSPMPTGSSATVQVNAYGPTGHHIVRAIRQVSHLYQSRHGCGDDNFTG
jgi:hypothetical protein